MKVDIDERTIDKLLGKRSTEFRKQIDSLEKKLKTKDNQIHELKVELERYKAGVMDTDKEITDRIAKIARALVGEMQRANWIEKFEGCGVEWTADE